MIIEFNLKFNCLLFLNDKVALFIFKMRVVPIQILDIYCSRATNIRNFIILIFENALDDLNRIGIK